MKNFKQYFKEDLKFNSKENDIEFTHGKSNDGLPDKIDIKKNKLNEIDVYSIYYAPEYDSNKNHFKFSPALHGLKKTNFNKKAVQWFLNKSAIASQKIIRKNKIDYIVMPKSSSALVSEFAKMLKQKNPKIEIIFDTFVKKSNLELKSIEPEKRKEIGNIFNASSNDVYNKLKNKNVLLLDDIMTTGTTLEMLNDLLKNHDVNNVVGLTLYKIGLK